MMSDEAYQQLFAKASAKFGAQTALELYIALVTAIHIGFDSESLERTALLSEIESRFKKLEEADSHIYKGDACQCRACEAIFDIVAPSCPLCNGNVERVTWREYAEALEESEKRTASANVHLQREIEGLVETCRGHRPGGTG
jgi:hypothetical protein